MSASDHPPPPRMAYRVREAAEVLAISRSRFYELVAAGKIRILKEGSRTLVRQAELERYLDDLDGSSHDQGQTLGRR